MALVVGGVLLQELVDNYTETYSFQGGPSCRKGFLCPWASRFAAIKGFLGVNTSPAVGGTIILNTPLAFPELANLSISPLASDYALNVEVIPVGNPTEGTYQTQWPYCKLIVTYGPFPWSWGGVDAMQLDPINPYIWIEQHLNYSSEYIVIPKGKTYWATGGAPTDADYGFPSPLIEMTLTIKNAPYLPSQAVIAALTNPINSVTYLGIAPGYLLFMGAQDNVAHYSDGTPARDVTYSFLARSLAPWDYTYNVAIPGWDQVLKSPGGAAIIGRSDISTLIPAAYNA